MASVLLRPMSRPNVLGAGLGLGLSFASLQLSQRRSMRLDSFTATSDNDYKINSQAPSFSSGGLNRKAMRQVSSGSILGVCSGLVVAMFSRSLTLIIGLLVMGVQWASSYGINVIPYRRLQGYVKGLDLRSVVQDNAPFKLSFGATFAMAAFLHF